MKNQNSVSYNAGDSLVFITSTRCPWCAKTLPIWKEIADAARLKSIQIIGISTDRKGELESYVKDNTLNFVVVNFPDPKVQGSNDCQAAVQANCANGGECLSTSCSNNPIQNDCGACSISYQCNP